MSEDKGLLWFFAGLAIGLGGMWAGLGLQVSKLSREVRAIQAEAVERGYGGYNVDRDGSVEFYWKDSARIKIPDWPTPAPLPLPPEPPGEIPGSVLVPEPTGDPTGLWL